MQSRWIVTPYFFDEHDPALTRAVPRGVEHQYNDVGALPDRSAQSLKRSHAPIAAFVEQTTRNGDLPVSIAGDCGASLPVMAGLQRAGLDPVLVWLDAHPDFNTEENSPTGFLGGMPLAKMVGRGDLSLPGVSGMTSRVEEDCWLVGARIYDASERSGLDNSQVHEITVMDLQNLRFDRPVHLHIDNDVVDGSDVPANNYPVADGPRLAQVQAACSAFARSNQICALSLSGWNGELDNDGTTAANCQRLMQAVAEAAVSGRLG